MGYTDIMVKVIHVHFHNVVSQSSGSTAQAIFASPSHCQCVRSQSFSRRSSGGSEGLPRRQSLARGRGVHVDHGAGQQCWPC